MLRHCTCRRDRLSAVRRLARRARQQEAVDDHVAIDRAKEAVRERRAACAIIDDVDRVERDLWVEEPCADRRVCRPCVSEVRRDPRGLVEQQRRLDVVGVGLQCLEVRPATA